MKKSERFERWFKSSFLFSRKDISPILVSENRIMRGKFERICEVATLILDNPKMPMEKLRKKVAIDYFISMRCSLDYINYAKTVLDEYQKVNPHV
jgi:hypothetical protein